jgi:gliding motility-associated-like protein
VYEQNNAYSGEGNYPNELAFGVGCNTDETNSVWYTFTIQSDGLFGFILTPDAFADDYDWALYNLTNANCGDIFSDPSLEVSCNSYGDFGSNGPTGISSANGGTGNSNGPGNTNGPSFNADLPVTAGEVFALLVMDWSGTPTGYTLDFSNTTAGIFDNVGPVITSASLDCDGVVEITFNEVVACESLDDVEWQMQDSFGTNYTATGYTSDCTGNEDYVNGVTLFFDPAVVPPIDFGFTINLVPSPGVVYDLCGNEVSPANFAYQFDFLTLDPTVNVSPSPCGSSDGEIEVAIIQNGAAPFSYDLDGQVQASPVFSGLASGDYLLTISDDAGCSFSQTYTVPGENGPEFQTIESFATDCGQNNGAASVTMTGGANPLSYLWDDPMNQTTPMASSLSPGDYTVTVTDANGCVVSETINVAESAGPQIDAIVGIDASCGLFNGEATATVSNGTLPYTYLWDDPANQSQLTALGLGAGTFTLTVTDANGCLDTDQVTLNATTAPVIQAIDVIDTECGVDNGSATVNISGGALPYTVAWTDPAFQTGMTATGLAGGAITANVSDAAGCLTSADAFINTSNAPEIVSIDVTQSDCDLSNGSAMVTANGGLAPLSYNWGAAGSPDAASWSGFGPGAYTLTVTDADGCSDLMDFNITQPPHPDISNVFVVPQTCGQGCQGSILIEAGNVLSYSIDGGLTTLVDNYVSGLCAGTYEVWVDGGNNCISSTFVNLDIVSPVEAELDIDPPTASVYSPTFSLHSVGDTGVESQWLVGPWGAQDVLLGDSVIYTFNSADPGVYEVNLIVTDSMGCSGYATGIIALTQEFTAFVPSAFTPDRDGLNDTFLPVCVGFEADSYRLEIFDRWGNIVFESTDHTEPWTGSIRNGQHYSQSESFHYKLTVKPNSSVAIQLVEGVVTMIR